jgi:hypothetical protein
MCCRDLHGLGRVIVHVRQPTSGRLLSDLGQALEAAARRRAGPGCLCTGYAAAVFPKEGSRPQLAAAPQSSPRRPRATLRRNGPHSPRVDLGIPADGAKVVIVKFNDYQCPGCGATHTWYRPVLERLEKSNPGAVKYIVKDWPWNSKCNFNLPPGSAPNHPGACEGAAAVRMARDVGMAKELEMQEWLYGNQPTMTPLTVRAAAERILGIKDFDAAYAKKLPTSAAMSRMAACCASRRPRRCHQWRPDRTIHAGRILGWRFN